MARDSLFVLKKERFYVVRVIAGRRHRRNTIGAFGAGSELVVSESNRWGSW